MASPGLVDHPEGDLVPAGMHNAQGPCAPGLTDLEPDGQGAQKGEMARELRGRHLRHRRRDLMEVAVEVPAQVLAGEVRIRGVKSEGVPLVIAEHGERRTGLETCSSVTSSPTKIAVRSRWRKTPARRR